MTTRRHMISSALFEAFFVVLGVVLALGANEWRQDRAAAQRAEQANQAIMEELVANRAAAEESRAYHERLMQLVYAPPGQGPELTPRDFDGGYVKPALLQRTAWDAARETGVLAAMPYHEVLELSRMYALQDRYEMQTGSVSQLIYQQLLDRGHEGLLDNVQNLGSVIATFAYRERGLVESYDALFEPSN